MLFNTLDNGMAIASPRLAAATEIIVLDNRVVNTAARTARAAR